MASDKVPDGDRERPQGARRELPEGADRERPARGGRALGRGLSALIGERLDESRLREEGHLRELPLDQIRVSRRQPRRAFDEEELRELSESVRNLGVVQPVLVRPAGSPGQYELVAGERRLRAARLAGLATIPAVVRPVDEAASLEIALAENVARQDLNAIEEAHAYAVLCDEFGLTHERIAELVGKSRVAVTNLLRLLELPDEVQALVEDGSLSEGHARALLGVAGHAEQRRLARVVVREGLTVRQTETLARKLAEAAAAPQAPAPAASFDDPFGDVTDELYGLLSAPVRIKAGKRGGRVEIHFKDRRELERLLELLRGLGDQGA